MSKFKIIATMLLVFCALAMAQKPKVAVGAVGEEPPKSGALKGLSSQLTKAIVKSGKYTAVDRSEIILKQLGKEFKYQMSGAVEESRIKQLGKQLEVDYLCIIESSSVMGGYMLDVKLIDVESAELVSMGSLPNNLKNIEGLMSVAEQLSKELLDGAVSGGSSSKQGGGVYFTDSRDGKKYKTVKIGSQTWMAENLNYDANGNKCYDNKPANCEKYGRLYNWETASKACPSGWHLPNEGEWELLSEAVGGEEMAGEKLKSKSSWYNNSNGTDEFGFSALPGGGGYSDGNFGGVDGYSYWWSAAEYNSNSAWRRYVSYDGSSMDRDNNYKFSLFSVRCLKD